tara:strand:+ start:1127 stop:1300 length:174 start_codon:yes stop_codon:yes gene_type:complete
MEMIWVIFLELQQSQCGKEARLKPLKMIIKNIKICSRKAEKTNLNKINLQEYYIYIN